VSPADLRSPAFAPCLSSSSPSPRGGSLLRRCAGVVCLTVALWAASGRADDGPLGLRMTTSATTVKQGDTFRVDVVLTVRGQDAVDEIEGPDLSDFDVVGQSETSNASFTVRGGRRAVVVEHRRSYLVRAEEPGTLQVGEVTARLDGNSARAPAITVRVVGDRRAGRPGSAPDDDASSTGQGAGGGRAPAQPGAADAFGVDGGVDGGAVDAAPAPAGAGRPREPGARFAGRDLPDVFVEVLPDKDAPFVGQQTGVVTEVWSRVPLGQYPRVPGPRPAGFVCLTLDDGERLQAVQRTLRGRTWFVYPVARDALFALQPGARALPAVTLDVTPAGSFFQRVADVRVVGESVPLEVRPLPEPAPAGFVTGNVGLWDLAVRARPARVPAGEPFTLIVEVNGVGNVDAVEPPAWSGTSTTRLFPPTVRRQRRDRDGVVAGSVVVETLVQPSQAGTLVIPSLALVTFSPDEARYVTRTAPPVEVVVTAAAAAAGPATPAGRRVDVGQGPRPLALDIEPRGAVPGDGVVVAGAAGAALGGLAGLFVARRRRQGETAAGVRRRRRRERASALDAAASAEDPAAAQRLLVDAVADVCGDDVRAVDVARWTDLLPARGLSPGLTARVVEACRAVDAARFAPGAAQRVAVEAVVAAARAVDAADDAAADAADDAAVAARRSE
jgi:hypothetical protein